MEIVKASTQHIAIIKQIAIETWAITYGDILSQEQISYMLDMMYSDAALKKQMVDQEHHFFLVRTKDSDDYKGFVSCETNYKNQAKTKIHKLYVLPQSQVSGLGKALVNQALKMAKEADNYALTLNVNKFNKSIGFYRRLDFTIVSEEDIDIGNGYLMEDYILEKKL